MPNPTKFSWTPPTTNTDGSPITPGEITGYQVGIRPASGTPGVYPLLAPVDPATDTSDMLAEAAPNLAFGDYAAAVRVVGPVDSAWSPEATFSLVAPPPPPPPVPSAPEGFTVA